ncbi:hypothetical protein [Bradyrhizobium commune]|uniref:Uncharacterized protein n=1 Tax=Bradyrhizobium commune TaxID=83627 RepID=A0A7S9GYI9_9BRAD|nr:hypothetical protein [Bradyrhizobium commune]QPF90975.1 hypothetical protein IC761_31665 [Bradyrhizobium commune]
MDMWMLKIAGQIAGIGGLALVILLILFRNIIRKNIFPTLKKDDAYRLLRLITLLTFLVALAGIAAWILSTSQSLISPRLPPQNSTSQNSSVVGNNNSVNQKIEK